MAYAFLLPAVGLALLLTRGFRGMRFFRTAYFVPHMMPTVAIGILWIFMYDPNMGVINDLLLRLGLHGWLRGWLGDEATALWAVIVTIAWQFIPFYMILFQAALVGIPQELYEAASIDGATGTKAFRHVALPLVSGAVRTAVLLSLVGSLKYFDLIYIMTGGGPNHANDAFSRARPGPARPRPGRGNRGSTVGLEASRGSQLRTPGSPPSTIRRPEGIGPNRWSAAAVIRRATARGWDAR